MADKIRLLLYSDGSAVGTYALALGTEIAKVMADAADILDVARTSERQERSEEEIEATAEELRGSDIAVSILRRPGLVAPELLEQADAKEYDLVVVGSRGRRGLRRLLAGSRACSILGGVATSVLVVKGRERQQIDTMLVCSAAGPASEDTVRFAGRLAHALGASVTLLHVMSQVALEGGAEEADLEAEAEELIDRHAREGVHLEEMLRILRDEGVAAEATVRHGLVVDEIICEAKDGHFDMLVVGSHETPEIFELLSSDLSQQIMLAANRPILIVHQK